MTSAGASETEGALGQLLSGTVRYFVIGAVARGVQFLTVPVLLRLLSPSAFGVQAVALLNEQLFMIVAGYAFTNAVHKHYAEAQRDGESGGAVLGTALGCVVLAGLGLLCLWQLAAGHVASLTLDNATGALPITRLIALSAVANLVISVLTTVWQLERNFAAFGASTIGQFASASILSVLLVAVTDLGAIGVVLGWTVASGIVAVVGLTWTSVQRTLQFERDIAGSLLRYGAPLAPGALMMLILTSNDRYLLVQLDGLRAVGVYAGALTIVSGINTGLLTPFKRSLLPLMWQLRGTQGELSFHRRSFTFYWAAQAWILVALVALGHPVMWGLSGGQQLFVDYAPILAIIYSGYVLLNAYEFLSAGYFFAGRTAYYPLTVAASTAAAIAWNLVFIPRWGVWGAATSNPISYAVFAVLSWMFGRRYFSVGYEWGRILRLLVVAAVLAAVATAGRDVTGATTVLTAGAAVIAYPVLAAALLHPEDRAALGVFLRRAYLQLRMGPKVSR